MSTLAIILCMKKNSLGFRDTPIFLLLSLLYMFWETWGQGLAKTRAPSIQCFSSGQGRQTEDWGLRSVVTASEVLSSFSMNCYTTSCLFPLQRTGLSGKPWASVTVLLWNTRSSYSCVVFTASWHWRRQGLPGPECRVPHRNVHSLSKWISHFDTNYVERVGEEDPEKQTSNFFKSFQNQM